MDTRYIFCRSESICFYSLLIVYTMSGLAACNGTISPTILSTPIGSLSATPQLPMATSVPLPPITPTPICTDNLAFVNDTTIPDGTVVAPGSTLDKQWLVKNSGDCNWDERYRLRLVNGEALGALPEQALYPARAGTQINLRIFFTAPQEPGEYISEWQAFDANGIPFGESFFMKIVVQN